VEAGNAGGGARIAKVDGKKRGVKKTQPHNKLTKVWGGHAAGRKEKGVLCPFPKNTWWGRKGVMPNVAKRGSKESPNCG